MTFPPPDSLIDDLDARTGKLPDRMKTAMKDAEKSADWLDRHDWPDAVYTSLVVAIHAGVFGLGYAFRMWVAG